MKEGIFLQKKTEDMNIAPQDFDVRFPERFIKNTDYYNSLMMMYAVPYGRSRPNWKCWMMNSP